MRQMSGIILERQGSETIHALVIKVKLREGNYLSRVTHLEWTSAVIVTAYIGLLCRCQGRAASQPKEP